MLNGCLNTLNRFEIGTAFSVIVKTSPMVCLQLYSKVWVPEPFREGSRSSVLLDCVYNYTMEDRDSLEVKWYFRQGLNPIYQWVPPNPPQVSKQVGLTFG